MRTVTRALGLGTLAAALLAPPALADIKLTEFLASNSGGLLDEDLESSDWIEIWNDGLVAVDLIGMHLTDDPFDLQKWTFPSTVLQPGTGIVVFASDKDRAISGSELHTNFKLTPAGEYLALINTNGSTAATQFAPFYPPQSANISYGFAPGTTTEGYFDPPTPGVVNSDIFASLPPVDFSHQRGFHASSFSLTLSNTEPGSLIYYTLDGTEPSDTNGLLYGAPIFVDETTLVRAVATKPFFQPSTSVTHSYIFPSDVFAQTDATAQARGFPAQWIDKNGVPWSAANGGTHPGASYDMDSVILGQYTTQQLESALNSIPTVSLVMGQDNWFGYNAPSGTLGIYANSTESSPDSLWVRKCSAEYFEPATGDQFQINCGVNIQGGSSPTVGVRSQLSIALKFQAEYGPTKLNHEVFPDSNVERFDYLLLDAGNQNSLHENTSTNFKIHAQGLRDQYMMDLQGAMGGLEAHGRYVHVFLDGLYWGMYNLHERPDERFAAEYQGGSPDEYDWVKEGVVLEGNNNSANDPVAPGDWKTVVDVADNGVAPGQLYNGFNAYNVMKVLVNLEDYADYMLLNFFGGNQDWPQRNWFSTNHARLSASFTDVNPDREFIFHSWDAEAVLHWGGAVTAVGDGFYDRTGVSSTYFGNCAFLYTALRQNPNFNLLFADRAHKHLFNGGALYVDPGYNTPGTVFDPAFPERNRPASLYHERAEEVMEAIVLAYARWGNYWDMPGEFGPWNWDTERLRLLNNYFPQRSDVLLAQLRNATPQMYPDLDAPVYAQHGGQVGQGYQLAMTAPNGGGILYTLDGTDPRTDQGTISPNAVGYTVPVALSDPITVVKARTFDGAEWSALNEAVFAVMLDLHIGEFMADNVSTAMDENLQFEDYVEVYNGSTLPADIGGFYLTDNPLNTTKWRIPDGTVVPALGTILVWADEDQMQGPLHSNFKLDKLGEYVGLYASDALDNILLDEHTFGPQVTDVSTGDMPDGGANFLTLQDPSPDLPNMPAEGTSVRFNAPDPAVNPVSLIALTAPVIGGSYTLQVSGGAPNKLGAILLGNFVAPVDLDPLGYGLINAVLPKLWKLFTTDAFGVGSGTYGFPNNPAIVGLPVFFHAYVDDPALSNAVVMTIGS